jgi:hypothetical protein
MERFLKEKFNKGKGGEIVLARPSASLLLKGRKQKWEQRSSGNSFLRPTKKDRIEEKENTQRPQSEAKGAVHTIPL